MPRAASAARYGSTSVRARNSTATSGHAYPRSPRSATRSATASASCARVARSPSSETTSTTSTGASASGGPGRISAAGRSGPNVGSSLSAAERMPLRAWSSGAWLRWLSRSVTAGGSPVRAVKWATSAWRKP